MSKSEHPNGAMDEVSRKVQNASTYSVLRVRGVARNERRGQFNGAMEEVSGRVQKASAYAGSVGVHIDLRQSHLTIQDLDAASMA